MKTRDQLILAIQQINRTVAEAYLNTFTDQHLQAYLDRLTGSAAIRDDVQPPRAQSTRRSTPRHQPAHKPAIVLHI